MCMHKVPPLVDLVSIQKATDGHMVLGLLPLGLEVLQSSRLVLIGSNIQFLEHTEICAKGDPMSTNSASSLTLLQANCLSDSLVKSKPAVRSMEVTATNPYRLATFATRHEYTAVISTPRMVAAMIFRSTNPIPSRSCIRSSKSFWSAVAMASRSASESRVTIRQKLKPESAEWQRSLK